jgi:hypothetical protein
MNISKDNKEWSRLDIHAAGLFTDVYEWVLVDLLYFRSHKTGFWTARLKHIRDNTPIKENRTILSTLNRLADKGFVIKENEGNPQKYRVGKGKAELLEIQKHKYTFYKEVCDMWLFQQCQFTQPAVSIHTAQQCHLTLLDSVFSHCTSSNRSNINKEEVQSGEHSLGKLSPNSGDTLQPSYSNALSINSPIITGTSGLGLVLQTKTIQPITANNTDIANTSNGKRDNTSSACQAVPSNSTKWSKELLALLKVKHIVASTELLTQVEKLKAERIARGKRNGLVGLVVGYDSCIRDACNLLSQQRSQQRTY